MSLVHQEAAQKRQKQVENLLAFFYIIFSPEEFSLKWERGQTAGALLCRCTSMYDLRLVRRMDCFWSSEGQSLNLFPFFLAAQMEQAPGELSSLKPKWLLNSLTACSTRLQIEIALFQRETENVLFCTSMKTLIHSSLVLERLLTRMRLCLVVYVSRESQIFICRVIIQNIQSHCRFNRLINISLEQMNNIKSPKINHSLFRQKFKFSQSP